MKDYKDKVYILEVRDSEDDYLYLTLAFKSEETWDKAEEIIRQFNDLYFEDNYDSPCGGFFEDLLNYLNNNNIETEYIILKSTVEVR